MPNPFISDKNKEFNTGDDSLNSNLDYTNINLQLREEKLDISKIKVQTGDVNIYKETTMKYRTIKVPIIREELVIEQQVLNHKNQRHTETIRIPISEEHFEVIKHPVILENIDIYHKKFQYNKQIEEIIKKEILRVQTTEEDKVIYK